MQFKDYYATLGVARDAGAEEIKKAFRRLARKYHPDVSKEANAEARMKEINEANAVLSDTEKRAAYDALGPGHRPGEEFRPPPDWDAGFEFSRPGAGEGAGADFSDFFAELFGRMGGARHARGPRHRGEDHYARILLDIEDAWQGAARQISLRVPKLDGEGRVVLDTRTLQVQIPKGVREGQLIRLASQGAPGLQGEPPGDLLLEVHLKPHPRFRAVGRDLHLSLPIAPWEAALGGIIPVELPEGAINMRIPTGAQAGKQLRVRGKGLPCEPPGDLYIDLRIVTPPAATPRAKELYEALAQETAFDARREPQS